MTLDIGVIAKTEPVAGFVNMKLIAPAGTVTPFGSTGKLVVSLEKNETGTPPAGAGPVKVTVPVGCCPDGTLDGLKESAAATGGITAKVVTRGLLPASVAVMLPSTSNATGAVVIVNVPIVDPAGMFTLAGLGRTIAALGLAFDKLAVRPPAGAGPERITVPVTFPAAAGFPAIMLGLRTSESRTGGSNVIVNIAFKLEPELAVTVTGVEVATLFVARENVPTLLPVGTVTPPDGGATTNPGAENVRDTKTPPVGAISLIVTVPVVFVPP